jgi:hypothetical protein
VPPVAVVLLDPGGDPDPGLGFGGEQLDPAQLELHRECQDSMTALSNAEPGRPIDWVMPQRAQAVRNDRAVYSLYLPYRP